MTSSPKPQSTRLKVRAHRERLRRQGLRPIQIWVPDVGAAVFRSEAHRQSMAVAESSHDVADQDFIDVISEINVAADGQA